MSAIRRVVIDDGEIAAAIVQASRLHDQLMVAAQENTERAQAVALLDALSEHDASLATKNCAQAALAQVQTAMTLMRPNFRR